MKIDNLEPKSAQNSRIGGIFFSEKTDGQPARRAVGGIFFVAPKGLCP